MGASIKSVPRTIVLALLLTAILYSEAIAAPIPELREDGWYSWMIQAVDGNTMRCCMTWGHGNVTIRNCNHGDSRKSVTCDDLSGSDALLIYARSESGTVTEIHAFSERCPIETELEIHDLGAVDNADSVSWLSAHISPASELSEDALAAVAVHRGEEAAAVLRDTARSDSNAENRAQALFWMAVTEREQSEAEIERAIADDPDSAVREEAVFALSLLPDERGVRGLISVLENRRHDIELREEALFWLAQSDSDQAFNYLDALLASK